ncbi:MAG: hypothetical protein COS34_03800 [Lysobacterales bacterium CG02_land_8_20_14_3_00_62_12]|nr:MAG: hypothetical protein COS34_03800 [Xanthomonadales bacterium CG02_land_8_20_14_3_00_62_12]
MISAFTAAAGASVALLLALFFHRQRLVQLSALLVLVALAQADTANGRQAAAAIAFVPWLTLLVAVVAEARWTARSQLLLLLLAVAFWALAVAAPAHVLVSVSRWFRDALPGTDPLVGAALVGAVAALICLLRWALRASISEFAATLAMLLLSASWLRHWHPGQANGLLLLAALTVMAGVLLGSYRMAFIDALTGLPNRRSLEETLDRLTPPFVLAMVDVDHFKQFNDSYGHAAGDIVLREVGKVLRRHSGALAFRYGGEEFCLVYEGQAVTRSEPGCERARSALESQSIRVRPAQTGTRKLAKPKAVAVTASFGLAARSASEKHPRDVLASADKALYKAKGKGRNRVEVAR